MQGMQGLGMLGPSGSSSQMLQRPVQSSLRPPSTPNAASQVSYYYLAEKLIIDWIHTLG